MEKLKKALLALSLIALVSTVSAVTYFIISNYIHKEATVTRINGIEITITGFPTEVVIGKNYTFTTNTKNVLDQELTGLNTTIKVWMENVTLEKEWLHVYYNDPTWNGTLPFTEQGGSLLCTIGPWTAPVGYNMTATINFRLEAQSPLQNGTIYMDIWVESPSFP